MRLNKNFIPAMMALLIFAVSLTAQSTNASNPTPLNGEYSGKGPKKETDFYFKFTAGPGDVSVRLEIKAKDYSTFARIEIGNDPANLIAMANMNASTTTGVSNVEKSFTLSEEQTIRIKLTLDGNLAEYKLSINGVGGSSSGEAGDSGDNSSAKTSSTGNSGKLSTISASKIGSLGAGNAGKFATSGSKAGSLGSTGGKPKTGTQNSDSETKEKLSFACPAEIMYKIVPPGDWKPGLFGQMRFLFQGAAVASPVLSCTYTSLKGQESVTILQNIPAGYTCEVWNGGPKTRDIVCTVGQAAVAPPPAGSSSTIAGWGLSAR